MIGGGSGTHRDDDTGDQPTRAADAKFELLLAATISEMPTVSPSSSFVDDLLTALPPPVALPEPSYRSLWGWAAGSVVLGAASALGVWHWRDVWPGWLAKGYAGVQTQAGAAHVDWVSLLQSVQSAIAGVEPWWLVMGVLAMIGIVAWTATELAEPGY